MKYFIFLFYISYVISYLTFPLSKKSLEISSSDKPEDILAKLFHCELYITMNIGSEKSKIKVLISQSKTELIIGGKNTKNHNYNELNSKSYNKTSDETIDLGYYSTFPKGILSTENFYINNDKNENQEVENVQFILAIESKDNCPDGEVGLHLPFPGSKEEYNLIISLKKQNGTKSYNWFFDFENIENGEGKLVVDALPDDLNSKKYNNDNYAKISTLDRGYTSFWGMTITDMYYEDSNSNLEQSVEAQFDFEIGLVSAPITTLNKIEKLFFKKYIEENICFKSKFGTSFVDNFFYCKNTKNFKKEDFQSIYIKQVDLEIIFELDYNDLFYVKDDYVYFLMTFRENSNIVKLGELFLKKYSIVFNQNAKTIGYYQGMEKEKAKKFNINVIYILIIIIILLIAIIIVGVILYMKKRNPRKNRANELDDDNYAYNSKNDDIDNKNKIFIEQSENIN